MDFGQLVIETYDLKEKWEERQKRESAPPCSPGVFFRILSETHFYQIQTEVRDNMQQEGSKWPFSQEGGHYFATPSFESAQVIAGLVAHKRVSAGRGYLL